LSDYKFTQDWFHWAPQVWEHLIPHLPERKKFLEIGAFEGRATTWIIENMMEDGGEVICIDTWEGGEEHINGEMQNAKMNFDHNINTVRKQFPKRFVTACKGLSREWLPALTQDEAEFDFIYIDGSHIAKDVLTDACMSWPLLKKGGIMVFDDYMWGDPRDVLHRPKLAIDMFTTLFGEELQPLHTGYQVVLKKV
jgi:predicted O-methyltransferase YrrM